MKILILKECCLGDLLMTTPLVRALRKHYSDAEIVFGVGDFSRSMIENNPFINRIVDYPRIWNPRNDWSLKKRLKYVYSLRREKFDISISLEMGSRLSVISWMIGAPIRIGFNWKGEGLFYNRRIKRYPNDTYPLIANLKALEFLKINDDGIEMDFSPTEDDKNKCDEIFKENNVGNDDILVGIAPGGGKNPGMTMEIKRWFVENYAELAQKLVIEKGTKIIFIGSESDKKTVNEIRSLMKVKSYDLSGSISISTVGEVLRRCKVAISNDSGPLHLSMAVKTPTIGIFGPTHPEHFMPPNLIHKAIWAGIDCSPCYKSMIKTDSWKCVNENFMECMEKISVEKVYNSVVDLLNLYKTR